MSAHFHLRIQPPPTSTLFPYTTLFRSPTNQPCPRRADWAGWRLSPDRQFGVPQPDPFASASPSVGAVYRCQADRKSTRLNSSHTVISYAVFCLKKKKNF